VPAIAIVAVLLAACSASRPRPTLTPAAQAAPIAPLAYRLLDGDPWQLEDARGRVLVVDVWATYCKPCRKAFPRLNALAAQPEVAVVGLSVDEDDAIVRAFLAETPATFSIARDPEQTVSDPPLGVVTLPTVILIDREGLERLRLVVKDEADYDVLPALIDALLAE
jgi:thiol-disulfide isomerase/thioredoxin